tara:strand:- start:82 stop:309 length:228 start_codon:yes stop_codon:yes gene_type:complete
MDHKINYKVDNKDSKWLSLRGHKINKNNCINFNMKQINTRVSQIIDKEFILEFNFTHINDINDKIKKNYINWLII